MRASLRRRFQLHTGQDLERLPDPEWLIEGLLPAHSFGVLFGPAGVGKSFLALDWGLSVAYSRNLIEQGGSKNDRIALFDDLHSVLSCTV